MCVVAVDSIPSLPGVFCPPRTCWRQGTELICVKLGFVVEDLPLSGSPVCGPRR